MRIAASLFCFNVSFRFNVSFFGLDVCASLHLEEAEPVGDALAVERAQLIEAFGQRAHVGFLSAPRACGHEFSLHGFDGEGVRVERGGLLGQRQLSAVAGEEAGDFGKCGVWSVECGV